MTSSRPPYRGKAARRGGISGLFGVSIVVLGTALTAAMYRGRAGESNSPLNHFVSELGQLHVSPWAPLFNLSLIAGNVCLIPFTLGVGRRVSGKVGLIFCALGLIAVLSGGLVGVFPMNQLGPHLGAAMVFFYSCLASAALFSIHALLFPRGRVGRWIALPGLLSLACFIVFLGETFRLRHHLADVIHTLSHRPKVWFLPLSEWLVFLSVLLWILLVASCQCFEDEVEG